MTRHLDRLREAVVEALEVIVLWGFPGQDSILSYASACHGLSCVCKAHCTTQGDVLD